MQTVRVSAYAKINLYLDVLGRRADGFHDICSVMQTVSLSDDLAVSVSPSERRDVRICVTGDPDVPSDGRNLAVRAAYAYLEASDQCALVQIELNKRIPSAAGLGGGSSDAAAVLRALNKLNNYAVSEERMLALCASLGSDVPFCYVGGTALCEGRGERMRPVPSPGPLPIVVACANERVSTGVAFAELDAVLDADGERASARTAYEELIGALAEGRCPTRLYNRFEGSALSLCEGARRIKQRFSQLGARLSLLSGSGPSLFGMFDTTEAAEAAARILTEEGVRAFVAVPVASEHPTSWTV